MIRQKANIQETSLLLSTVSRGTASVCDWFISSPTNQPVWRLTHWLIDWLIAVTLTHSSVIPMCQGWGQLVMSWVGVCSSHKFLPMLSHYLLEGHSVRNKPVSKGSCVVWAGEQYRHDNRLTYIHRCQRGDGAGWQCCWLWWNVKDWEICLMYSSMQWTTDLCVVQVENCAPACTAVTNRVWHGIMLQLLAVRVLKSQPQSRFETVMTLFCACPVLW